VVACRLAVSEDELSSKRPRQLRQVFTFALDKQDMERLWLATGCAGPGDDDIDLMRKEDDDDELLELMERQANGLFLSPQKSDRTKMNGNKKRLFL
jgi:hypothetical protein